MLCTFFCAIFTLHFTCLEYLQLLLYDSVGEEQILQGFSNIC